MVLSPVTSAVWGMSLFCLPFAPSRLRGSTDFHLLAVGRDWWLPPNYAVHGRETDALFTWFFWVTFAVMVGVEVTLVAFMLRYRAGKGDGRRPVYSHGKRAAELTWTLVPTVILAALAIASKRVWDDYRSSPDLDNPRRSKVLIIGQQFMWNVVYPGPDGRFGRYGVYPRPTDATWPVGPDGSADHVRRRGAGRRPCRRTRAARAINDYVDQLNPLGKDFADPAGRDDDWSPTPGRPIYVPVDRPVEFDVMSKDVIHDFFLPNFRAQLYAVPGMVGRFVVTPTATTADLERASRRTVSVDALPVDAVADIEPGPPAVHDKTGWRYVDSAKKRRPATIVRDGYPVPADAGPKLRAAGITAITVHTPAPFEVVCAQLCGIGHSKMRAELIVLSQAEFDRRFPAFPNRK